MTDKELILKLELKYRLNSYELPEFSRVDGYLIRGNQIKYWVERKVRNVPFDAYPDAVVDLAKWQALIHMEQITTIPAILAYGWSCGTWGIVQPSKVKLWKSSSMTPSLDSVSLNAGVNRDVVHIYLNDFEVHRV